MHTCEQTRKDGVHAISIHFHVSILSSSSIPNQSSHPQIYPPKAPLKAPMVELTLLVQRIVAAVAGLAEEQHSVVVAAAARAR